MDFPLSVRNYELSLNAISLVSILWVWSGRFILACSLIPLTILLFCFVVSMFRQYKQRQTFSDFWSVDGGYVSSLQQWIL